MKPYFTLSKKIVLEQFDTVNKIADIVSYSSKTNPLVTPILESERECLFSVHDENELKHINDKSRVLFLAQGLSAEQLERLFSQGIKRFVIDNEEDLDLLIENIGQNKIELMLRATLKENTIRTEKYFVFGMNADVINKRIMALKNNSNIISLGIHFHRKSQNIAEWNLQYEVEHMFTQEVIETVDVLNIGGGLPSVYANTNEKIFDGIFKRIETLKEFLHQHNSKLVMEPGRFIAAPAGKLHANITLVYDHNIIVDASVYNTDMDALIVPVKLLVENELEKGKGQPYVIKGRTPCNMDLFRYRVWMENPKKGDAIVFLNAGAYNFSTDFCDLEKLETKVAE